MFSYDLLVNYIADILPKPRGRKPRPKKVRFAIFGFRGCGKTTLINRMLGRPIYTVEPPTIGSDPIRPFTYYGVGKKIRVEHFADYAGDPSYWSLWDQAFVRDKPQGIIFMLDHKNLNEHLKAFQFMLDFISLKDRRWLIFKGKHVAAREQLKVMMFLANKEDRWSTKYSLATFMRMFSQEFYRVEDLGISLIYHSCSALTGLNVDTALSDFFTRMLGDEL